MNDWLTVGPSLIIWLGGPFCGQRKKSGACHYNNTTALCLLLLLLNHRLKFLSRLQSWTMERTPGCVTRHATWYPPCSATLYISLNEYVLENISQPPLQQLPIGVRHTREDLWPFIPPTKVLTQIWKWKCTVRETVDRPTSKFFTLLSPKNEVNLKLGRGSGLSKRCSIVQSTDDTSKMSKDRLRDPAL